MCTISDIHVKGHLKTRLRRAIHLFEKGEGRAHHSHQNQPTLSPKTARQI